MIFEIKNKFFFLILSVFIQLFLGAFVWKFCTNVNSNKEENKLNLSLIVPLEEEVVKEPIREILHLPEQDNTEIKPIEMSLEEIIPIDPFNKPMINEMSEIPKLEPIQKNKKKEIRKEAPKIIKEEKKEEIIEVASNSSSIDYVKTETVSVPIEIPVKKEKQIPVKQTVKTLTKAQQNETSKYLSKIMKIFEKNKKYPDKARVNHIEGKILVSFCIDNSGRTSNVKANTQEPSILAKAAEELVKKSVLLNPPKHWNINSRIELPIIYKLK